MTSRFIGNVGDMVPLADFVPHSLAQLEGLLHVVSEPEDVRRAAVEKWLETNEPTPYLQWDLGEHGIGGRSKPC